MSYHHVSVSLTPGQIKKLQSSSKNNCAVKISLKREQLTGGPNKLSLTDRQYNQFNEAKRSKTGVRLNLSAAVIKDIVKSGGIFPLLAAIPALMAAAAPAVAKAAALGAIGTAAGMALKKATGQGISQKKGKGLRLPGTPPSWYGKGLRLPGTPPSWYGKGLRLGTVR